MELQPIETAPQNGTPILAWGLPDDLYPEGAFHGHQGPRWFMAKFEEGQWVGDLVYFETGWESTGSYTVTIILRPTHWMPLPEPPEGE